jgi:hypothetical protein
MSNKDSLVIQPNSEVISDTDLQSNVIVFDEENRQKLIQILRQIPAIFDLAKKLSEGKTYQAIFTPEVLKRINDGLARLDKKDNGLFGAVIRDVETGQITDHVSLKEVMPDLLSSLNQLAVQQTLADIVCRLEVIDEKITDVLQGQINDRLAEVESGISLYKQAIAASDPEFRQVLLGHAIHSLNSGRNKLMKSADFGFFDKLPRNKFNMWKYSIKHGDITENVQSKAKPIWQAAHSIVEASRYLILAYSVSNEPGCMRASLEEVESKVKVFQDKMGDILNRLPPTSDWRESLTAISQGVLPNIRDLDDIPQKIIVVEFQPKEIAPPIGV